MVFFTALFNSLYFEAYHVWGHFNWGFLGLCNQYFSVFILLSPLLCVSYASVTFGDVCATLHLLHKMGPSRLQPSFGLNISHGDANLVQVNAAVGQTLAGTV